MVTGWVDPEEWLHPQVQEALSAWSRAHRPSPVVYRVVGERWDPACHDLRDSMGVNSVPCTSYLPDGDDGRQLVRDHGVDVGRLPAAIRHDGTVLHQPPSPSRAPARQPCETCLTVVGPWLVQWGLAIDGAESIDTRQPVLTR